MRRLRTTRRAILGRLAALDPQGTWTDEDWHAEGIPTGMTKREAVEAALQWAWRTDARVKPRLGYPSDEDLADLHFFDHVQRSCRYDGRMLRYFGANMPALSDGMLTAMAMVLHGGGIVLLYVDVDDDIHGSALFEADGDLHEAALALPDGTFTRLRRVQNTDDVTVLLDIASRERPARRADRVSP